jgi:hypothetical protein
MLLEALRVVNGKGPAGSEMTRGTEARYYLVQCRVQSLDRRGMRNRT